MDAAKIHISVLLEETMSYLKPSAGGIYVDGTMGLGGHSSAILDRSTPDGKLIAFEWDENAINASAERLAPYKDRLSIVRRNFADITTGLDEIGVPRIDGLMIDIGLSSLQLDTGVRGFSFKRDDYLDMRMDERREHTAADIIAKGTEEQLADIFYCYGEERQARPIAASIVAARKKEKIETTKQLVSIIVRAIPKRFHPKRIHVATKVFQALRIAVNTELENLSQIIDKAVPYLAPGARFCIISFHSLEDRIVKRKFRAHENLKVLTNKPIKASEEEIQINPRSRSALLRVAEKI
ncbi:MAG: 16S rRNA (cytosine(1402)-N(4))-methyltransferase RsmH [Desulfotalea sp.]